jgi:hypothetical protein
MNMKALKIARKVSEELDAIADAARELFGGVENESDEQIEDAVNQFPTPKQMAGTFGKLGELLTEKPWEKRRKADG